MDSSVGFSMRVKFLNDREFRINDDPVVIPFNRPFRIANGEFEFARNPNVGISKDYTVNWQPTHNVARAFAGSLNIVPKTAGTGILSISMQSTNAQMAADIINSLMLEYAVYSIEQKRISADQILNFIDMSLYDYGLKLDSVQRKLLEYEEENNLIDIEKQSGNYFGNISEADRNLYDQTLKLNVVGLVDDYLADKKNEFSQIPVPSSLGLDDATLSGLVSGYNKAQMDRKLLVDGNVPADNPAVLVLNGQIEGSARKHPGKSQEISKQRWMRRFQNFMSAVLKMFLS